VVISTDEERNKLRVKDRPAACLAEVQQWLAERNQGKFTAPQQLQALRRLSEWGSANLLSALIDVLEGKAAS
jgi:hypothetical protein